MKKATKYFAIAISIYFSVMLVVTFIVNQKADSTTDKKSSKNSSTQVNVQDNEHTRQNESQTDTASVKEPSSSNSLDAAEQTNQDVDSASLDNNSDKSECTEEGETAEDNSEYNPDWDFNKDRVPLPDSAYESQSSNVLSCLKGLWPWK